MKAIIHANLYDYFEYRENTYILFDDSIREVGPMDRFPGADEVTDVSHCLVMPGLVNGHCHMYSAFFRGLQFPVSPRTFTELLKQYYWRIDGQLDKSSTYHGARVFGIEHIRHGVTTIFDHHASGLEIGGTLEALHQAICLDTGMRGVFCFETSDRFPVEQCIRENVEFASKYHGDTCRGVVGLHASLSLSDKTLQQVSDALEGQPVHVHVGESLEDEIQSINQHGCRVAERFDRFGLLTPGSILAHCVNIDSQEAEIISRNGCAVALNPASNMNTAVGLPDWKLLKRHGIRTFIGNDSLGIDLTRDYLTMMGAMHLKTGSPVGFSHDDLLECIRNVYAHASELLGVSLGRILPGYVADLITVPCHFATEISQTNAFACVADGVFNNFHPRDVWVGGKQKMAKFETSWDEEQVYAQARLEAKKLWERIEA